MDDVYWYVYSYMFTWFQKRSRITQIGLGAVVALVVLYVFASYTMPGRITALYLFGGMGAPWATKSACIEVVGERIAQKFALPLDMDRKARNALREYWYYSYYRQCLYDSGYDFSGHPLPETTLDKVGDRVLYQNDLASTRMFFPKGTELVNDNKLDVDFDYRLLKSVFNVQDVTVYLHTYVEHDDIHTFDDLVMHVDQIPTTGGAIIKSESHRSDKEERINYIAIMQDDGYCGAVFVPYPEINLLFTRCEDVEIVWELVEEASLLYGQIN